MLWRDMRGRTKEEIHKELKDLDPIGFPHLEEKVIGGNVDLDLLSLFPQKDARFKINNGGERSPKTWLAQGGRRIIYKWVKNWPLKDARDDDRPKVWQRRNVGRMVRRVQTVGRTIRWPAGRFVPTPKTQSEYGFVERRTIRSGAGCFGLGYGLGPDSPPN
jgi:hypothetical protein